MGQININEALNNELHRLAVACRILAMEGHDDVSLGHLSLPDPEGRGVWMKRFYLGLDEVRGADDFLLLDFDGNILHGAGNATRSGRSIPKSSKPGRMRGWSVTRIPSTPASSRPPKNLCSPSAWRGCISPSTPLISGKPRT